MTGVSPERGTIDPLAGADLSRNVADLVAAAATAAPGRAAFVDATDGTTVTWSKADAGVHRWPARLAAAGMRPGDRVAVRLPTGIDYCLAVFGVLRGGGVL